MRLLAARWSDKAVAEHVARHEHGTAVEVEDGWAVQVDRPHPWERKGGHERTAGDT
jgi:hypothetical protein